MKIKHIEPVSETYRDNFMELLMDAINIVENMGLDADIKYSVRAGMYSALVVGRAKYEVDK